MAKRQKLEPPIAVPGLKARAGDEISSTTKKLIKDGETLESRLGFAPRANPANRAHP